MTSGRWVPGNRLNNTKEIVGVVSCLENTAEYSYIEGTYAPCDPLTHQH